MVAEIQKELERPLFIPLLQVAKVGILSQPKIPDRQSEAASDVQVLVPDIGVEFFSSGCAETNLHNSAGRRSP